MLSYADNQQLNIVSNVTASIANSDISAKNTPSLSEAVLIISTIQNLSHQEALTEFEKMTTISMDDALNMVITMKNNYLEQKGFKPYQDTDGRWRGYVYQTTDGKRKRKAIAAQTREEVEKKAIAFYKAQDSDCNEIPVTLLTLYPEFMASRKEDNISENTTLRDYCDWKRFLENDALAGIPLKSITFVEFSKWFKKKLKEGLPGKTKKSRTHLQKKEIESKPYTTSQAKALRTLLTNMFQYAVESGYMRENLSSKLGKFRYSKYCQDKGKSDSEQVYQDDEPTAIMELAFKRFQETHNFAYFAVILLFLLDVRSGELVALKYSDLEDRNGQIHIQRQEVPIKIYDDRRERYVQNGFKTVEHTKTWEDRYLVLSDAAKRTIDIIRTYQKEFGLESEYLFLNKNGDRMHANSVQKVLREDLNVKIKTPQKSCKNIRKTVTSQVREELGVSVAAQVAGHKSQNTTDRHYSYATRTSGSYAEEYTKVIDSKVPDCLKTKKTS